MDFLSERSFQVKMGKSLSAIKKLKVGCVQGSILGPKLFTMYMRKLPDILGISSKTHLVAYADDAYVSIAGNDVDKVKTTLERSMAQHDDYLLSIGMKTNVSKTELIYFSRRELPNSPPLLVKENNIYPSQTMKVLGVKFQNNLKWDTHVNSLVSKSKVIFAKLRYSSKILNQEGIKKVVTPHFYGMLYYSFQVWLNELTTYSHLNKLTSLHYKALRSSLGQTRNRTPRSKLDEIFKRATPRQWSNYSNAKRAINLYLNEDGPPISQKLKNSAYIDNRTELCYFMDTSRLKVGKNSFQNRLQCLKKVKFKWINGINYHTLRINLKKTFHSATP